jgi:hypothetical protein
MVAASRIDDDHRKDDPKKKNIHSNISLAKSYLKKKQEEPIVLKTS